MGKKKKQAQEKSQNQPNQSETFNNGKDTEDEWERTSIMLKKGLMEEVRKISYWERKTMRETMTDAVESFLYLYKQHAKPVPVPVEPVSLLDRLKKNAEKETK